MALDLQHTMPEFNVSLLREGLLRSPMPEGGQDRILGRVAKATKARVRRFSLAAAKVLAASAASVTSAAAAGRSTLGAGLGSDIGLMQKLPWCP